MMHMSARCIVALAVLCVSGPCLGEDDHDDRGDTLPELLEELPLGELPYVQEEGEWQFTFGFEYFDFDEENTATGSLEVEFGITDRWQLSFEFPYVAIDAEDEEETDVDGIGDVSLGTLLSLYADEQTQLSAGIEVSLPTGDDDRELGEGRPEFEPLLALGHAVGEGQLIFNLGGEISSEEQAVTFGLAYLHPVGPVTPLLELTGSLGGEADEIYFTPGLAWEGPDDMAWTVGTPVGLSDEAADWGAIIKLIFEF